MKKEYYAHSLRDTPFEKWQKLEVHLKNVASLAELFANLFNSGEWAYAVGL